MAVVFGFLAWALVIVFLFHLHWFLGLAAIFAILAVGLNK